MIAVIGATGKLGRLVVEQLGERVPPSQVVAAVRSPEKARELSALGVHVRQIDYREPRSLTAAFAGVHKVLLIPTNEHGKRIPQHVAVIEAAERAKISLLAYASILRAESSQLLLANEHRETERIIRKSGLPFVLLRNGWYIENYTEQFEHVLADGRILGCAGQGRVAAATRADYAEAAALVLTADSLQHQVYELAGDAPFTLSELASEISRVTGKSVRYEDVVPGVYRGALIGADVTAFLAELLVDTSIQIGRGDLDDDTGMLRALLGRPTTPLRAALLRRGHDLGSAPATSRVSRGALL